MLHACQHQNILFDRSLASKFSNTPKMIFISHLETLQISYKAKFHAFFEKFSHLKLKPAPTQDNFLDFLQNDFFTLKMFPKSFFHLNGGGQALCACACPDGHAPLFNEKKLFGNILSVKIHFVKSKEFILSRGWFQL